MPTIDLQDVRLQYDDSVAGEAALLLIHGHPFDRSMWHPQRRAAEKAGWRVIVPDLRGYGESYVTPQTVTLETFARDLGALLLALGIGRAVVGGLSMGGQIAMEFCALFPERVAGLLLAATFPQSETAEGKVQRNRTADRLEREGMAAYANEALPRMLAPETLRDRPDLSHKVLEMMRSAPAAGAAAALRGRAERQDYSQVLGRLEIPALIVGGDRDAFTTRSDAENMHRLISGSRLLWMEGVGHMPNLEGEELFNAAMIGLLNAVRSPMARGAL